LDRGVQYLETVSDRIWGTSSIKGVYYLVWGLVQRLSQCSSVLKSRFVLMPMDATRCCGVPNRRLQYETIFLALLAPTVLRPPSLRPSVLVACGAATMTHGDQLYRPTPTQNHHRHALLNPTTRIHATTILPQQPRWRHTCP